MKMPSRISAGAMKSQPLICSLTTTRDAMAALALSPIECALARTQPDYAGLGWVGKRDFRPLPGTSLSSLRRLSVDGLDGSVEVAALGDGRQLGGNRGVDFGREDAVVDVRNLGDPVREVLPHGLAA